MTNNARLLAIAALIAAAFLFRDWISAGVSYLTSAAPAPAATVQPLAKLLLQRKDNFAEDYANQLDDVAKAQYGHIDQISGARPRTPLRPVSQFPNLPPGPNR